MKSFGMILVGVLIIAVSMSLFVVNEAERAVVTRFGKIVQMDVEAGLGFKLPLFDKVHRFDSRRMIMDMNAQEQYITAEKKRLTVDSYVVWRIKDVAKYFVSTRQGDQMIAERILRERVDSGLRNKFGARKVDDIVSGERDELMREITEEINDGSERQEGLQKQAGIEVVDVRLRKVDWPEEASEAVFMRMRVEREREAREHRSEGKEQFERVTAEADRERRQILADARQKALEVMGEGDAEAAGIYANAYNKDREFYNFYRSLRAYRNSFSGTDDVLVLDPDSDFFKYFGAQNP